MEQNSLKKILFPILAALLVVGGGLLVLRARKQAIVFPPTSFNGSNTPILKSPGSQETPPTAVLPQSQPVQGRPMSAPVRYLGRPLGEVKPDQQEVASFSDEQRQHIYNEIGNYADALTKNPDFFNGWIQLGLLKKGIGDYIGARDAWEYAGMIRAKNSVSFGNLGELYANYLHKPEQAEQNFKRAITNDPADWAKYISLADLYTNVMTAKSAEAPGVLLGGIKKNPDDKNLRR